MMSTGNNCSSADSVDGGDHGNQRTKRRRADSSDSSPNDHVQGSQKKKVTTDEHGKQITQREAGRSQQPFEEESSSAIAPQLSAYGIVNAELDPLLRRLPFDNLESQRQLLELSRSNGFNPSVPMAHPLFSHVNSLLPQYFVNVSPLQYQPLFGFGRAAYPAFPPNVLGHSSLAAIDPLYTSMLSSLRENAAANRPTTLPHEASLATRHLETILQSAGLHRSSHPPFERASQVAYRSNDAGQPRCPLDSSRPAETLSCDSHPVTAPQEVRPLKKSSREVRPQKKKRAMDASSLSRTILYIPDDDGKLNEHQIFLRKQIEIFRATQDDILSLTRGKNKPIVLQQVGLRCRHCSHVPVGRRKKGATYFPSNLMGIYQAAQNLSVEHLQSGRCTEMPPDVREQFSCFATGKPAASGAGKKYWAEAGGSLGLIDTEDGIFFAVDVK